MPDRRLRRSTYRLRRAWHRGVRPLRRPARVLVVGVVLVVAVVGAVLQAQRPVKVSASATVRLGPDSTAVLEVEPRGDAALAGLRTGDRLVSIDGDPVSAVRAAALAALESPFYDVAGDTLALGIERDGRALTAAVVLNRQDEADARRFGLSDAALTRIARALFLLVAVAFIGAGLVLVVRVRARGYHASLGTALLAVAGALGFSALASWENVLRVPLVLVLVLMVVAVVTFFTALPAFADALVRFPDGRYGPRWTRRTRTLLFVGLVTVAGAFIGAPRFGVEGDERSLVLSVGLLALVVAPVVGLVQKYRRAEDAVVRQQMKWAILPVGTLVGLLLVPFLGEAVAVLDADRTATGYLFDMGFGIALMLALAAVPLAVLAGALNFRPWDADLWIARSAAVGTATVGLAAVFAGGAEALRVGLRASMGDGAEAVAAALAAVVALAVFNPVRERLTKRANAEIDRTRERLTERLPLLLASRQVVATPEEVGRVALAAVGRAFAADRAAVLDLDPGGWEVVAAEGIRSEAARAWAEAALDSRRLPAASEQVWEDPTFVLRVPLRSAEDELVGVLALGTHGKGRGYSTEERKALDAMARSLAEALRVAERRVEAEAALAARLDRLAALTERPVDGTRRSPVEG